MDEIYFERTTTDDGEVVFAEDNYKCTYATAKRWAIEG